MKVINKYDNDFYIAEKDVEGIFKVTHRDGGYCRYCTKDELNRDFVI